MAHHQGNISLGKGIEGCPFRKYPSDEFMSNFNAAFLVGTLRVTVEYSGSASAVLAELNGKRIANVKHFFTSLGNELLHRPVSSYSVTRLSKSSSSQFIFIWMWNIRN